MNKIRVFVSSTCYDLSQIRKDLKEGIEAMGHLPMLSENKDFPINPALNTVENCIEAVRNDADIFVLIIGGHYGYKLDTGKSITNTEYLTALEKGIPIYTFTLKNIISVLPVWKNNPSADFSSVVNDNKVFEFVEDIREKSSVWNFEFESAQDIIEILKSQWSFLFKQALVSHQRISKVDDGIASKLSNKALKLLLEKGESYEMLVFLQMMKDEIEKYKYLKKDCVHSVVVKHGQFISEPVQFMDWQREKLPQLEKLIDSLNNLFKAHAYYYGEPGVPADIDGLYYVAHRYGELYCSLLNWVIDVRSINTDELFTEATQALSNIPLTVINQLENYPDKAIYTVQDALNAIKTCSLPKGSTVDITLHLSIDQKLMDEFSLALDNLHKALKYKYL